MTPVGVPGVVPLAVSDWLGVDIGTAGAALVTLVGAYLLAKLLSASLTALADRLATQRFRITLFIPVLKFVVYGVALYTIVSAVFSLTQTQVVAFSGVLGAVLGFGLKDLVADVFGGLVLVAEQPYRIGDKVSIGDHYGEVVDIGVRSTKIVTPGDTLVTIPNYLFFNEAIANANAGQAEMLVTVEFYIDPDSNVRRARRIVEDALYTSQYVYVTDERPVVVRVEDDLHYRTLTGKAYVDDLRNEFAFRTDVTERVLEAFAEAGIRSPKVPASVGEEGIEE